MMDLGLEIKEVLDSFARLFSTTVWVNAQILLVGAILCIGKRTVTSALRVMGLGQEKGVQQVSQDPESGEMEPT
ncbi:unnamed protein product [marine sediment metagenome]|uniref:Uncharacterized protein n=1 Tax=marine sediment metagenome TaxID=412755 RepID=X1H2F3_9ZZZZ